MDSAHAPQAPQYVLPDIMLHSIIHTGFPCKISCKTAKDLNERLVCAILTTSSCQNWNGNSLLLAQGYRTRVMYYYCILPLHERWQAFEYHPSSTSFHGSLAIAPTLANI